MMLIKRVNLNIIMYVEVFRVSKAGMLRKRSLVIYLTNMLKVYFYLYFIDFFIFLIVLFFFNFYEFVICEILLFYFYKYLFYKNF